MTVNRTEEGSVRRGTQHTTLWGAQAQNLAISIHLSQMYSGSRTEQDNALREYDSRPEEKRKEFMVIIRLPLSKLCGVLSHPLLIGGSLPESACETKVSSV